MDGNVEALRERLLDHYGVTTFNMCEHHPLTLMKGESLQLHVDSNDNSGHQQANTGPTSLAGQGVR